MPGILKNQLKKLPDKCRDCEKCLAQISCGTAGKCTKMQPDDFERGD